MDERKFTVEPNTTQAQVVEENSVSNADITTGSNSAITLGIVSAVETTTATGVGLSLGVADESSSVAEIVDGNESSLHDKDGKLHMETSPLKMVDASQVNVPDDSNVASQRNVTDPAESLLEHKSRKRKQSAPQQFKPLGGGGQDGSRKESHAPVKMLPIHCKVEITADGVEPQVKDGYAIIPSTVRLCDLIKTALTKLEFDGNLAGNAEGSIQLKNWKPLMFSTITDKEAMTVGELFADILTHLTLNIKVKGSSNNIHSENTDPVSGIKIPSVSEKMLSSKSSSLFTGSVTEVRRRLLQVLEKRGATLLVSHGCPFSQATVTAILQGRYSKLITPSKLQAFYRWFNLYSSLTDYTLVSQEQIDSVCRFNSRLLSSGRTLFDPLTEVPKLMKWFKQNPRPTRAQMEMYLAEMNSSDYRKQGVMLQYSSIAIWFKNARVKYRNYGKDRLLKPFQEEEDEGKENLPVDLSQQDKREDISDKSHTMDEAYTAKGGLAKSPKSTEGEKIVKSDSTSPSGTPVVPVNGVSPMAPCSGPPMLLVPTPAHINGQMITQIPSQMLMQPQQIALQQNIAAFPRHGLVSQAPMGLQPHVMVGQTPVAVQPQFTPFVDMRRMQDYTNASASQTTPSGQDLQRTSQQPQLSIPNYTPVNSGLNGNGQHSSSQLIKAEKGDHGSCEMGPQEDELRGHPNVMCEAIPAIVPQSCVRLHSKPTRKRFNIDYAHDLPKLQQWFEENPRPDRDTIERYVDELNSSEFRVGQPEKYTPRVVYVWFKNARAKILRGQKLSQRWHQIIASTSSSTLPLNGEINEDES